MSRHEIFYLAWKNPKATYKSFFKELEIVKNQAEAEKIRFFLYKERKPTDLYRVRFRLDAPNMSKARDKVRFLLQRLKLFEKVTPSIKKWSMTTHEILG